MIRVTIAKLRESMYEDPCPAHKNACPIPSKTKKPCQWGHTAMEFAEHCDPCALRVTGAIMSPYTFAQRLHHMKTR